MLTPIDEYEEKILLKFRELPGGKRTEVLDFIDFLRAQSVLKSEKEGEKYSHYLETLRKKIRDRGGLKLGKTREDRMLKLKDTRETIWKENYANRFGHQ
jgi:hypothetical protein